MKNWWKAGMLIVLLVVPASVFLFLKGFGTNHYTLRTYFPLLDSATGKPLVRKKQQYSRQVNDTLFHTVPAYALTDQHGREFTASSTGNKTYVASFFHTRCSSPCPTVSAALSRVQDFFLDSPEVLLVSYTVDPAHDSVPVLSKYAGRYRAKPGKWYFLTGAKRAIYQLAQKGYFIPLLETEKQTQSAEEVLIDCGKLVLVDREKHIRGYYDGTDPKEVDRLILETRILLSEYKTDRTNE